MTAAPLAFLGVFICFNIGASAEPPRRAQTRHLLEVFNVPSATAYDLLSQDLNGSQLHARMLESLKDGTATLGKLMTITASAGVQASLEQTEDYLYPTELDPPQLPQTLAIINPDPKRPHALRPEKEQDKDLPISPFNAGLGTVSTTTPTAFGNQQLGDRLEMSPGAPDEHGRLPASYTFSSTALTALSPVPDLPGPVFTTKTLKSAAQLTPGLPAFLGTCSAARRTGVPQENVQDVTSMAFITARPDEAYASAPDSDRSESPFKYRVLRSTVEIISMDKAAAHSLLLTQQGSAALYQSVVELIREAKAVRETTLCVRSRPEFEVKVERSLGYQYPTEFDPPQIPQFLILGNRELLQDLRAGRQRGVGAQPSVESGNPNGGFGLMTTLSPTAFQVNNLGEELQILLTCRGEVVEAVLALRLCHLDGTVLYNGIKHPVFGRQNIATTIRAEIGRPAFLGTLNKALNTGYKDSNKEDRIWLAFLRVSAR